LLGIEGAGMHQNGAKVFDAVVLREFVEHLEGRRRS